MTKSKPITPQEQEYQIINQVNAPDCTNVSDHVQSSHFYLAHNLTTLGALKSSK